MAFRLAVVCALVATSLASPKIALDKELKSSLHQIASRNGLSNDEAMKLVSLSDPKSNILEQLNDLLTDLRTEQNNAVDVQNTYIANKAQARSDLEDTLNSIQGQIQDTENYINQAQATIGKLQTDANDTQAAADDADSQVKLYKALLDRLISDHQASVDRTADIIKRHDDSLATLQQLIDMISNFQFTEAATLLRKQHHSFLHREHSKITLLVRSMIQLMTKEDGPQDNTKQKLLTILNQIKQGTEDSRAKYVEEAQNEVDQFNQTFTNYSNMIANFAAQHDAALAQLADINNKLSDAQNKLSQAQDQLANLQANAQATADQINALDTEVANQTTTFNSQSQDRVDDMNAIEAAIQFVNDHIEGMSVHEFCNIGAPDCSRCLTSDDCGDDQICSDDGQCQPKPQPVYIGGTVNEHDTMNLVCPDDKHVSSVNFASYGMPTGGFPNFQTGTCDATSTNGVVSSVCIGKSSCSIPAENGVFGDPCYGTFKHMSIVLVCA